MELRLVNSMEDFYSKREAWNRIILKMKDSTPFQTWEWNYYWCKNHCSEKQLFIIEAYEARDIFGFAPLVIKDRKICFIGDVHFDYGLFIMAERKQEIFNLFMKRMKETADKQKLTIHLMNIPTKSDQYSLFRDYSHNKNKCLWKELVDTASVCLTEYPDFQGYLRAISTSLRKKAIKPCLKNQIEYSIVDYSEPLWQNIEEIYQNRMEDRVGKSTLEWAQNIVRDMCQSGIAKISLLKYQGEIVAFLIYFKHKKNIYIWLTAFKKTEKLQLGHFIRYKLIEHSYNAKIDCVDMMRGAYNYKKQWDCNVSSNWEFLSFNSKVTKIRYIIRKSIRRVIRDIVYNTPWIKKLYRERLSKI